MIIFEKNIGKGNASHYHNMQVIIVKMIIG